MKLKVRQTDFNSVELTISATGRADDPVVQDVTHLPFNGLYKIDWGDGTNATVMAGATPSIVTGHDYPANARGCAYRGYVEGDARIPFHALASS